MRYSVESPIYAVFLSPYWSTFIDVLIKPRQRID